MSLMTRVSPIQQEYRLESAPYSNELKAAEALLQQSKQKGFTFGFVDPGTLTVVSFYSR